MNDDNDDNHDNGHNDNNEDNDDNNEDNDDNKDNDVCEEKQSDLNRKKLGFLTFGFKAHFDARYETNSASIEAVVTALDSTFEH